MSSQSHRLPSGGRIDRSTELTFSVDDVEYTGHPGDTVAAALSAARSGARVIILDEQQELGGSLLSASTELVDGRPATEWLTEVTTTLAADQEVTVLPRTLAFGSYDDNYVLAVEDRATGPQTPGVSRQRVWHIRAGQGVLATGA